MIRIPLECVKDCIKIRDVLLLNMGVVASIWECHELWEDHSRECAAKWLALPDEAELVKDLTMILRITGVDF